MLNRIYDSKVVNVLSNNDYTSSSIPSNQRNEQFLATHDVWSNAHQPEFPEQQPNLLISNTYSFFNSMHPNPLSAPMQMVEGGYFVTAFNPLEVNQSIDNNSLFQHAPSNFGLNAGPHVLLGQAENNSQGGLFQSSSYAELLGTDEYYPPRWQASVVDANLNPSLVKQKQSNQTTNPILQPSLLNAAQMINSGSIQQNINQFLLPRNSQFRQIKADIIRGAENLKNQKNITEEKLQNYIEESNFKLIEKGLCRTSKNIFLKKIEIIFYGEKKTKKCDSTKFNSIKEYIMQMAVIIKNKANVKQEELNEFFIIAIAMFKEESASPSAVDAFSKHLKQILNEKKDIKKHDSEILSKIKEEIIIDAVNRKSNINFTIEEYEYYIEEAISLIERNGASQFSVNVFLKDLDIILYGEKNPNKNDSKKFKSLTLAIMQEAREMKSDVNATEEDFQLYVNEVACTFINLGASSSTINRVRTKLEEIFNG